MVVTLVLRGALKNNYYIYRGGREGLGILHILALCIGFNLILYEMTYTSIIIVLLIGSMTIFPRFCVPSFILMSSSI